MLVVTNATVTSWSVLRLLIRKYLQFSTSNAPAAPCGVELNTATVVYGWTNNDSVTVDDIKFALDTEQTADWKTKT